MAVKAVFRPVDENNSEGPYLTVFTPSEENR
jgi:hypothetical protein